MITRFYINDTRIFSCDQRKLYIAVSKLLNLRYKSGVWQGSKIQSILKQIDSYRESLQKAGAECQKLIWTFTYLIGRNIILLVPLFSISCWLNFGVQGGLLGCLRNVCSITWLNRSYHPSTQALLSWRPPWKVTALKAITI